MPAELFDQADLRTLALARPQISAEAMDRYLSYREALADLLSGTPSGDVTELHRFALERSGFTPAQLTALEPLCREFAGKEAVKERVRQRIAESEAKRDFLRVEALRQELESLSKDRYWETRYGVDALRLLRERRDRLVALHERMRRLELHPSPRPG